MEILFWMLMFVSPQGNATYSNPVPHEYATKDECMTAGRMTKSYWEKDQGMWVTDKLEPRCYPIYGKKK